ncbi:MAG: DUF371 domain-containing protein, partial [Candidatus Altiarchaeota archaeon]|nr:DUF371 domain-containing protein [Candidatus Altiarchaeota archaeon]
MEFEARAMGHVNVLCLHEKTLEFTAEDHLTKKGDCIFAVCADKTMADLPEEFKERLKTDNAKLKLVIECGGVKDEVTACGSPDLILTHPTDFVVRKSNFICSR